MRRLLMLTGLVTCSCSEDGPTGPPGSAEIVETGILLVVDGFPIETQLAAAADGSSLSRPLLAHRPAPSWLRS